MNLVLWLLLLPVALENTDLKELEVQKQLILEKRDEKLKELTKTLVESQVDLEPEFAKHIKDNIENLLY